MVMKARIARKIRNRREKKQKNGEKDKELESI